MLSFTVVICPKFDELKLPLGRSKCGLFNTLKMSALNSPLNRCANDTTFASTRSTFW